MVHPKILISSILISVFAFGSLGCERRSSTKDQNEPDPSVVSYEYNPSPKNMVKRRRMQLVRNTLAKVLTLDPQGMCLELGRLPCADMVHKVSLGGMNAYGNAQYLYPENASVTSPMAFDRLVLSACIQRASLDLANPDQGVIFKDVELSDDQRLVYNQAVDDSIKRLYQRSFLREPTQYEIDVLKKMYEEIYETKSVAAARNWMVLSCYTVLSSLEAAFY